MNDYASGIRKINSIEAGLQRLKDYEHSPAVHGEITTTLHALNTIIANLKLANSTTPHKLAHLQNEYNKLTNAHAQLQRQALLSPSASTATSSSHPYARTDSRTQHALRESDFVQQANSDLDNYLAQGQAVLSNLALQRSTLKGTKTKLLNAANTLGLSRDTIHYIDQRTKGDWYILCGGATMTLVSFYLIIRYFG